MVDQMWHLDLSLQLQGEMFAGLLQDIVFQFQLQFSVVLIFTWSFLEQYFKDIVLTI